MRAASLHATLWGIGVLIAVGGEQTSLAQPIAPVIGPIIIEEEASEAEPQVSKPAERAPRPVRPLGEEEAVKLIADLDADQYGRREAATERLSEAGPEIIPGLRKAAEKGSLELAVRAVFVLRELALRDDFACEEAAREALESLAKKKGSGASGQASETLAKLNLMRTERTMHELLQLGALNEGQRIGGVIIIGGIVRADEDSVNLVIGDQWKGTANDLRRLKRLENLRSLTLTGDKVDDSFIAPIREAEKLTSLQLKRTKVTDQGLAKLAGHPGLSDLAVMYTPVGNESLGAVESLKSLTVLKLYGTKVTKEAAEQLSQRQGNVKIDFRRGAFLGVGCSPHPAGCQVMHVQPNSAAEKAGIEPEDVIIAYEGEKVGTFENLTVLIGKHPPGHTAKIEILRGEETLQKQITLGAWD